VELECFGFASTPAADESGQLAVASDVTVRLDLRKQRLRRTPMLLGTVCIGFERLLHRVTKRS
jgi:hypothetical protein